MTEHNPADEVEAHLEQFFATSPPRVAELRCACGRVLLACYSDLGQVLIVRSMGSFHHDSLVATFANVFDTGAATPTPGGRMEALYEAWTVADGGRFYDNVSERRADGIVSPIVNRMEDLRWPTAVRCRDGSSVVVDRHAVEEAVGRWRSSGKPKQRIARRDPTGAVSGEPVTGAEPGA